MTEATAIDLLTRLARRLEGEARIPEGDEFEAGAERLASAAWSGLVLLLRGLLGSRRQAILEEIGRFERAGDEWQFWPAASVVEADALQLPAEEGQAAIEAMACELLAGAPALLRAQTSDPVVDLGTEEGLYGEQTELARLLGGVSAAPLSTLLAWHRASGESLVRRLRRQIAAGNGRDQPHRTVLATLEAHVGAAGDELVAFERELASDSETVLQLEEQRTLLDRENRELERKLAGLERTVTERRGDASRLRSETRTKEEKVREIQSKFSFIVNPQVSKKDGS